MRILATLCYLQQAGKTLMLYRNKKENDIHEGKWNGVGGKFEEGETPEACAVREIEEETGLHVRDPKLVGILTFPQFDGSNDWYVFVFIATQWDGEQIESPEGHLEWIATEKVLALPLWEGDRIFLPWIFSNRFFSACFQYQNGRLTSHTEHFYSNECPNT